jgi:transcription antitermination factor NusG
MSRREAYASEYLKRAGYTTYCPRLREHRTVRGRRIEVRPPLFPAYVFVLITDGQWYSAQWCVWVISVIRDGANPAKVPDRIIDSIQERERNGLIELPKQPRLRRGDRVRITEDRVAVLLKLLGALQRTELPANAVEAVS